MSYQVLNANFHIEKKLENKLEPLEIRRCFACDKPINKGFSRLHEICTTLDGKPFFRAFSCKNPACEIIIDQKFPLCRKCGRRYFRSLTVLDKDDPNAEERLCLTCSRINFSLDLEEDSIY